MLSSSESQPGRQQVPMNITGAQSVLDTAAENPKITQQAYSVIYSPHQYQGTLERTNGLNSITKTNKENILKMIKLNIIEPGDGLYLVRSKPGVGQYAHVAVVTDITLMHVVHAVQNSKIHEREYGKIVEEHLEKVVKKEDECFIVRYQQEELTGNDIAYRAKTFANGLPVIKFTYDVVDANCEVVFNAAVGNFSGRAKKMAGILLEQLQKTPKESELLDDLYYKIRKFGMLSSSESRPGLQQVPMNITGAQSVQVLDTAAANPKITQEEEDSNRKIQQMIPESDEYQQQSAQSLTSFESYFDGNKTVQQIVDISDFETVQEIFKSESSIRRDIYLNILHKLTKNNTCKSLIQDQTNHINTNTYKTMSDVVTYLDAIVESGLEEETKVKIMLLGNTASGKSSIAGAIETQRSFLTSNTENRDLLETKLLNVKKNIHLDKVIESNTNHCTIFMENGNFFDFDKNASNQNQSEISPRNCTVNIFDAGGHTQYETLSSLLLTDNTIFLIVFQAKKISTAMYQPLIGSYLDMVAEKCNNQSNPIIILTVSKIDEVADEENFNKQILDVERIAKEHVEQINSFENVKIRLAKKVIYTSAKDFKNISFLTKRLRKIIECEQLITIRKYMPFKWKRFIDQLQKKPTATKETAMTEWEKLPTFEEDFKGQDVFRNELKQISYILKSFEDDNSDNKDFDILSQSQESGENEEQNKTLRKLENVEIVDGRNTEIENAVDLVYERNTEIENAVDLVLRHAEDMGETISFKHIADQELNDIIFTDIMAIIKSLSVVIRHDVGSVFQNAKPARHANMKMKSMILDKGIVTQEAWKLIVEKSGANERDMDRAKKILEGLKVAFPLGDLGLFIPCLISDEHRKIFQSKGYVISDNIEGHLVTQYHLQNQQASRNVYEMLLMKLAEDIKPKDQHGISFELAFSQKREDRTLGIVSGIEGELGWLTKGKEVVPIKFKILDEEIQQSEESPPFAVFRVISLIIAKKKIGESVDSNCWDTVKRFDKIIKDLLKNIGLKEEEINPRLVCNMCLKNQYTPTVEHTKMSLGFFNKPLGMLGQVDRESCQIPKSGFESHTRGDYEENKKSILIEPEYKYKYKDFLRNGIENIPKMKFSDLKGQLEPGDQIWIYRQRRFLPLYAHVVVYIDDTKVCHVKKCSYWKMLQKMRYPLGVIKIEPLGKVIEDNDLTFLGHDIPEFKKAVNTTEQMIEDANKCAQPPLIFDYDHMNNCEGFANALMGFEPFTAQGEEANIFCRFFFGCLKWVFRWNRIDLATALKKRLQPEE